MNLDAVKDLSVLVVGDDIVDEYCYVKAARKSIKEPALSATIAGIERYPGGTRATAEHLRTFCRKVDVMVGDVLTVSRRYVEQGDYKKLFTVHATQPGKKVECPIHEYDVVIVTDFGYGTIHRELLRRIEQEARYLCVNAQTNSSNFGFNLVTKYTAPDLVVVDELEARLAAHDNVSPLEGVINALPFKKIIVTRGSEGAMGYDQGFHYSKPPQGRVLDTMGAGDAFLAVVAPFARAGFSMEDLLQLGNAAGAAKVGIVGHRSSVTKEMICLRLAA